MEDKIKEHENELEIRFYISRGQQMNSSIKDRIISELDNLPDQKGYSLLDFLHFLKQEQGDYSSNLRHLRNLRTLFSLPNRDSVPPWFKKRRQP